jgi:hypothetical protein
LAARAFQRTSNVLGVPALEIGDPIAFLVLMKADNAAKYCEIVRHR